MKTKICTKCGRELPLECFSKNKKNKDGLNAWCKECHKEYWKQWRVDNDEHNKQRLKQWYADNAEALKEHFKQWRTDNPEYMKQYMKQWRSTIEGYAYNARSNNLQNDIKYGRIAANEDPLPPLEYYIECFAEGIDYYDGKHYPFNELGFDRNDDNLPHTIDNMVVATTFHNKDRWHKHMTVEEYKEYIQKQNAI